MAKPGSDRDGAMVDKQAGKKVCKHIHRMSLKMTLEKEAYQIYFCIYSLFPPPVLNTCNECLLCKAL